MTMWAELADKAVAYRNSKGFAPATWETCAVRLGCIAKEINELELAFAEFVNLPMHGDYLAQEREQALKVRLELADIAIYTIGLQRDLGFAPGTLRKSTHERISRFAPPEVFTAPLRKTWACSFEFWQKNNEKEFAISLELLIAQTATVGLRLPGGSLENLPVDCVTKLGIMARRPALHGGKNPIA